MKTKISGKEIYWQVFNPRTPLILDEGLRTSDVELIEAAIKDGDTSGEYQSDMPDGNGGYVEFMIHWEVIEYVLIPAHVFRIMRDTAEWRATDTQESIDEGMYEDSDDNALLMAELNEAAAEIPVNILNFGYNIANADPTHPDGLFPSAAFTHFEVHPCKQEADGHVHQCEDGETPDFWSVYLRYNPDKNAGFGGLDCIADFKTENEAIGFKNLLDQLVKLYTPE